MDKRRSAVFGRLFSFIGMLVVVMLFGTLVCACDKKDVSSLFTPSNDFQVTFVLNNGEDNVVWHKGDVVPSPTKDGFKFVGWCNDATLTSLTNPDFDNLSLSQNLVLYAKWEELPDIEGVTFDDVEVVYDGNMHTLEVGNLPSGATVVYDVSTSYINVGTYTINALVSLDGYKDLLLCATLTIKKAVVRGINFEDKDVDWDGRAHSVEISGKLPSEVSVSYLNNEQSEVGEYKVVARFSVSDNYEPIEDMSATLRINEVYFLVSFVNGNGNVYAESVAHGCGVRRIPELYQRDGYVASWENIDTTNVYSDLTINAVYTPIVYAISFVSLDDVVGKVEYNIEKGVTFSDWQRDCYTFDGWYEDRLCTGKRIYGIGKGNIGDKTYYAKWIPIEYTVRYHLNGGLNNKQNVNSGEEYVYTVESSRLVLEEPSKSHYVFEGWFANADFTGMKWEYLPKGASGNREFYAKWSPETYSVEYRLGGGENHKDNPSEYNYESDKITLLSATKEHYDFVCWRNEKNEVVNSLADGVYGDMVLIAQWKAIEHTIYLCDEQGSVFGKIGYTIESEDVVLEDQLKAYYDFVGWFDDSGREVVTISADTAKDVYVYTSFKPKEFAIIYAYNGGKGENVTTYNVESEDIVLNEPVKEHYVFLGWYNGNEKVEVIKSGSHGNITLQAKWEAVEYTMYLCHENGDNIDKIVYTVESEDIVLQDQLKAHYDFIGWFDEDGNKVEIIPASTAKDVYFYTKFKAREYTIAYAYNGGSGENITTYTIESVDIVLNEPIKDYYTFLGWYNNDEKVEVIKSGSHGNITLQAKWKADIYFIAYYGVENTSDYVTSYTVESDDITLPIPTRDYYVFDGWYTDKDFGGNKITEINTKNPQKYNLYAKFTAIEYHISYNLGGGNAVDDNPTSYTIEDDDIILIEPNRKYYTFLGWYNGTEKVEMIKSGSHGDISLQAKWQAIEYTVYLCDANGVSFDTIAYTVESDDVVLKDRLKPYYDFVGWFDESGNKIEIIPASLAQDVRIYASFKAKEFSIAYAYNGGAGENVTSYTIESDDIVLNEPTREYYTFLGWYSGSEKIEVIEKGSHGNIALQAKWQADEYSIAYYGVEDTAGYVTSYTAESENIILPTPSKDYYTFDGWYANKDYSGSAIISIDTDNPQNYSLYAKFTTIKYRIVYELNNGSNVDNPTSYTVEDADILLVEPIKEHYIFLGWYNGNEKVEVIKSGSHGNITLQAKWKAIEYKVYLIDENGVCFDTILYTVESNDIVLEDQLKAYYDFVGWFDNGNNKIDTIPANTAKDVYLYALFKAKEFTIAYAYNGGIGENVTSYTIESEDIILSDPIRDYYTFLGWYNGSEKVEKIAHGSHGNITLQAKWQAIEYSVAYYGVDDTTGYVTSYTVEDEDIILPIQNKDYYTFDGWYASQDFSGNIVTKIDTNNPQNYCLYAKFTAIEYHISYNLNGGNVEGNPYVYTVEDADIKLVAPAREYYNFLGWYNGDNRINIIDTSSPMNIELSAQWQAIEYSVAYYGVDDTTGYVASYTVEDEDIILPIQSKDYYTFDGWYTSQDFSGNMVTKIDTNNPQNYRLYAKFTAIEYHISYNLNGGSEVDNPTIYTVESDTIILLSPIKDNYTFVGWYSFDNRVYSIDKGSHGDITLEARWSSDVYTIKYSGVQDTSTYPTTYSVESGDVTLPTPNRDFYNFIGWYESEDFVGEKITVIKANSSKHYVLYPCFTPVEYTLTYDYNGGLDARNATSFTVESETISLNPTSKTYYNFIGWYIDDVKVDCIEKGSHGDKHLVARFEAKEYTITYHNVENASSLIQTYTIEDGEVALQKPQKDYYNFAGWYLNSDFSGDIVEKLSVSKNGDAVVYAKFMPINYSITYSGVDGVENSNKVSYTIEDDDIALLNVQKLGYDFIGWYDSQTNEKVETILTANACNCSLYAKFSIIEYSIIYEAISGLNNPNRSSYTVEDDDFALLDVQKLGYDFIGWYDSQTNEKVETILTANACNRSLYAKFSIIEYTITYEGIEDVVNDNKTSYTIEDNDFTLSDVQKDKFEFLGWYDKSTDNKVDIIDTSLAKDIILVAKWNEHSVPTLSSPFVVDENGCLVSIDATLLADNTRISIPSNVNGANVISIASGVFNDVANSVVEIEIAEGIVNVASDLFNGMSKLEKLVLPSTITTMYKGMLTDCISLCDLSVPFASFWVKEENGTSAIGYSKDMTDGYAYSFMYLFGNPENTGNCGAFFMFCMNVAAGTVSQVFGDEYFYLPNTLTHITVHGGDISSKAFFGITPLTDITLGSNVLYINQLAFAKCTKLNKIVIKGEDVTFDSGAFAGCNNMGIYVANDDVKKKVDSLILDSDLVSVNCSIIE